MSSATPPVYNRILIPSNKSLRTTNEYWNWEEEKRATNALALMALL
jgi:hypothetical protein